VADETDEPIDQRDYFVEFLQVSMGIAPDSITGWDREMHPTTIDDWLAMLPPDDARKAKRKFRKLWRKAARRFGRSTRVSTWTRRSLVRSTLK
jgi:hypothetical protein